jgi:hypothetical protein
MSVVDSALLWGKTVHAAGGFCAALLFGLLLLGWRDRERVDLSDELATLMAIFFGIFFGVIWEIVEFIRDWVTYGDLQRSNSDTMTDFLCNDVAAILAAVIATRLYCGVLRAPHRERLGRAAAWLVDGPSGLLERHGFAMTIVAVAAIGASVLTLWFTGRPVPGIPIP